MKTAELKNNLHKLIDETNNDEVLSKVNAYFEQFRNEKTDWWDTIPNSIKEEVKEAVVELENNNIFSHSQVQNEIKTKYNILL